MTAKDAAKELKCSYATVLSEIRNKHIKASKEKCRWNISSSDLTKFKQENSSKIEKLQKKYVKLYWSGLNHRQIQKRVLNDFAKDGIICKAYGFAEIAIYNDLMKSKRGTSPT